jgi:hypothetical protein
MKKVAALPLIFLILFSGISLKYSAHMCGGTVVATLFSLKDEAARCSMEDDNQENTGSDLFKTGCCENINAYLQFRTNYVQTSVLSVEKINVSKYFSFIPFIMPVTETISRSSAITGIWPPGRNPYITCSPEALCIFRI